MQITDFYKDKQILITGVTGFLGKVVFEKILRSLPLIRKVYVLMRSKKGSSVVERFKKIVMSSLIFDRMRKQLGEQFDSYISQKVHIIDGELLQTGIGLTPRNEELLIENVNVIIHCAASVDFDAKLIDAININVIGTLRMYNLYKKCKNACSFIQVSTCFANSDKFGWIEENIYESNVDPDKQLEDLISTNQQELEKQTKKILGKFPNTYTYTKSLTERTLKKRFQEDHLPLTILRPSVIGAAARDPFKGWVEGVTASSALYMLAGIGMIRYIYAGYNKIGDIIPVDYVSDYAIVLGALTSYNNQDLTIVHCGSSSRNPVTWGFTADIVQLYWQNAQVAKRVQKTAVSLHYRYPILRTRQIIRRLPAYGFRILANILQNQKMQKDANRLMKMLYRSEEIALTFSFFACNEWTFDTRKVDKFLAKMNPQDQEMFQLDITKVEWYDYFLHYNWGMHRYILNENIPPPVIGDVLAMQKQSYFSDIQWALTAGKPFKSRTYSEYRHLVLNSPSVQLAQQSFMQEKLKELQSSNKTANSSNLQQQANQFVQRKADEICLEMFANYKMPIIRMFAWMMHKIFKQIYEKVIIEDQMLQKLKKYDLKEKGPLILIPTHRSYIDFIIVSYIFFAYKLQAPHIAAAEEFLKITLIHHILRASGAFFIKRQHMETHNLYKAILTEYLTHLLMDDCFLEFFVEGTRSRSGKMLHPKFGILGIVIDAVLDQKIQDGLIVPITINYDKVLEADTYPYELLGEEKVKESLPRLIKASKVLSQNYGRIYVQICEPIGIKDFIRNSDHRHRGRGSGLLTTYQDPELEDETPDITSSLPLSVDSTQIYKQLSSANKLASTISSTSQIDKSSSNNSSSTSSTPTSTIDKYNSNRNEEISLGPSQQAPQSIKNQGSNLITHHNRTDLPPRKILVEELAYEVLYQLTDNFVITSTTMTSTILLMHRKGISEDQLVQKVEWLSGELISRGAKLGSINDHSGAIIAVRNAINLLDNIIQKTKKNVFEMYLQPSSDYKNVLMLSYYRNGLMHIFLLEAFLGTALMRFGHQLAFKEGVPVQRLWEEFQFLKNLLKREYVIRLKILSFDQFLLLVNEMLRRKVVVLVEDGKLKVANELNIAFYCSLIWPLVETYWATIVYLFSLQQRKQNVPLRKLNHQIQWFAENLYDERLMEFHESCSLDTIKNAVECYQQKGIIRVEKITLHQQQEDVVVLHCTEQRLLEFENRISMFLKSSLNTTNSPADIARRAVLNDYPLMSKL